MTTGSAGKRARDAGRDGADDPVNLPRQRRPAPQAGPSKSNPKTTAAAKPGNIPRADAPAASAASTSSAHSPAASANKDDDVVRDKDDDVVREDLENEGEMDVGACLDDAGMSRRTASRIKGSVEERPAGYTLEPLKVTILDSLY